MTLAFARNFAFLSFVLFASTAQAGSDYQGIWHSNGDVRFEVSGKDVFRIQRNNRAKVGQLKDDAIILEGDETKKQGFEKLNVALKDVDGISLMTFTPEGASGPSKEGWHAIRIKPDAVNLTQKDSGSRKISSKHKK